MEAGIERLSTATKLSSCPSAADGPAARHRMSSQASSMRTIMRADARLAWLSIGAADCSSPTMLETRFGACHRIMPVLRPTIDETKHRLARGAGRAVRLAGVALGGCGHLNCRPGNQQRAENG